jgi:hypothetical protein
MQELHGQRTIRSLMALGVLTMTLTLVGCGGNERPVADAGQDQTVQLPAGQTTVAVTLDGNGSFDPDGLIVDFRWAAITATTPTPDAVERPTVDLEEGGHTFSLIVVDNDGDGSTPDTVTITVQAVEVPGATGQGPAS